MCGDKDVAQRGSDSLSREDQAGLAPGWAVCWLVHPARAQQLLLVSVPLSHCVVWGTSHTPACLASLHLRDGRGKRECAHSLWRAAVARARLESGYSPALLRKGSGLRRSMETHDYSHHFGSALSEKKNPELACGIPAGRACSCLWAEPAGGRHKSPRQTSQGPHGLAVLPTPSLVTMLSTGPAHHRLVAPLCLLPQQGSALTRAANSSGICRNSTGDRRGQFGLELIDSEEEHTWSDF